MKFNLRKIDFKITFEDKVYKAVASRKVIKYLEKEGWKRNKEFAEDNLRVYEKFKNCIMIHYVMIPMKDYLYYAMIMKEAIQSLSIIEGINQIVMLEKLGIEFEL